MAILLGGGGDADDERPVLDRFAALCGIRPVAYWPVALGLIDYREATAFATAALGRSVSTWERLEHHTPTEVAAQAGSFIGGGDTFRLLNEIRVAGLDEALRDLASAGVVYGGSAGAIVLGADIGTAGYFDRNEVGLSDTACLDLLGGYAVWCHYIDDHLDPLREWIRRADRPVVALPERAGAEIDGKVLTSIGHEPLIALDREGAPVEIALGQSLVLTQ